MTATIHPRRRPGIREVVFSDVPEELDAHTVPQFEQAIGRVIERYRYCPPARLVVDLSNVTFMCSSGVQALLDAKRAARQFGMPLWVRNPRPVVTKVLDILDLTDRLVEPV